MENIYIFSIKKVIKNGGAISFNSLKRILEENGFKKHLFSSDYFRFWFYTNFYQNHIYQSVNNGNKLQCESALLDKSSTNHDNNDSYLTYGALCFFQQSKYNYWNRRIALIAIIVSTLLLVANIVKMFFVS